MRRILEKIEAFLLVVATVALLLMMAATSVDALGRELFAAPLQGNYEVTGLYFMVILVFASLSSNYAGHHHVRVDIFLPQLKQRLGRNHDRIVAVICLPVFALFAWHATAETIVKLTQGEAVMGVVPFPVYLSYLWVAVGCLTLSLRFLLDILAPLAPHGGTSASASPIE